MDKNSKNTGYVYGDKLPTSLLTDEEWAYLTDLVAKEGRPFSKDFRRKLKEIVSELNEVKCVGENEHKCVLCGMENTTNYPFCPACYSAIYYRSKLRFCGNTREFSNKHLVCATCGDKPVIAWGLCRNCYFLYKYYNLNSVDELKEFMNKRKEEALDKEREINCISEGPLKKIK